MAEGSLKVLFLAAEAVPLAKVGGLADVAGSLPKAIRRLGHDVRVMMPRYGTIKSREFHMAKIGEPFTVPAGPAREHVHLVGNTLDGDVPIYLVWNEQYFSSRDRVYGFEDDAQRFAVFGHAALGALRQLDWVPDVIHANDWHTGLVPAWLDTTGREDAFFRDVATLFTIHNLAYQGITGRLILTFAQMEHLEHLPVEAPGDVNWMAQGISHADLVNTVSPRYAQEILEPEVGMGLESLLQARQDRLSGVLNGLDYEAWDPATDPAVTHHFDADRIKQRTANKTILQQQAHLPVRAEVPIIGMVSRLDEVKGMDLMEPVLNWLLEEEDAQFIVLGTGRPEYHEMFERFRALFPGRMHAFLKFDDALARRIYAGADMFLMPSRIEPCGLGQMIAMRYGCVPIVRATGGLADTVVNHRAKLRRGTGFSFTPYTPAACKQAVVRALKTYRSQKAWHDLQRRAMESDLSWSASALEYVRLYHQAIQLHEH